MFYANFVLAKKGPLARVWLAAHWEKKLSKAHVFETDLESSVENIKSPKVKIALRTSGHLLLGVVRIYSRKAKYLLADCTEALIKIKMAFRPDVVDLPLDNQQAAASAITLPEHQEWDQMLNDLGTFDINNFNNNVCRVEDITMKEDLITSRFLSVQEDNFFGDTPFGEITNDGKEILRDAGSMVQEDGTVADLSKTTIQDDDENNTTKGDTTLTIDQSNLDLNNPMMGGDGFGAGEGLDFMEEFGMDGIGGVPDIGDIDAAPKLDSLDETLIQKDVDELPKTPGRPEGMDPIDGIEDISAIPGPNQLNGEDEEMESQQMSEVEDNVDEIGPGLAVVPESTSDPVPNETAGPQNSDAQDTNGMTTLFSRDEEALNLEPIEVVDKGKKSKKRKRKLVVDQDKILSNEQIKGQISNDEDIIKTAVVAPPTKARFVLLESSTRTCFTQPPCSIQTKRRRLNDIYNANLTLEKPEDFVLPSSQDDLDEVHLDKVPEAVPEDREHLLPIVDGIEEIQQPEEARHGKEMQGEEVLEHPEEDRRDIFQEFIQNTNNAEIEKHIEMDDEMKEVEEELRNEEGVSIAPAFEVITEERRTNIELADDGFQIMYEECEEEEDEDEDPHFVDNTKRWTKRTHQTLKTVQKGLTRKNPLYFTDLTKKSNRKQAAYSFYTLLILSKEQALDIQQSELFGDITIDRGVKFDVHL